MMDKYKLCPVCGRMNAPILLECEECEADLSNLPVVTKETNQDEKQQEDMQSLNMDLVRICECGVVNPVQARKCSGCGEELLDVIPVERENAQVKDNKQKAGAVRFILSSLDGDYSFELVQESIIVGREHEMKEYLTSRVYVSREHAQLLVKDGKLFIRNISATNFTYVNQKKIPENDLFELNPGDEIGLGGALRNGERQKDAAYFIIKAK